MRGRRLAAAIAVPLGIVALLLVVVGPWPAYRSSGFASKSWFRRDAARITALASAIPRASGALIAGWARAEIRPPKGVPLAGYGERSGASSTGRHDPISVKALAVAGSANHRVAIASADLLIVPENIAREVRRRVALATPEPPATILFGASHTHSGPGASSRGILARLFAGRFDRLAEEAVVQAFVSAIVEALADMRPARIASGSLDASAHVRNRTRASSTAKPPVDGELDYAVIERAGGERFMLVRFSAHATVLGASNLELSGDFPGYLQRTVEEHTGALCLYLAGATGSMGPVPPAAAAREGESPEFARARAMGEALAGLVTAATSGLRNTSFREDPIVSSVSLSVTLPPLQLRIAPRLRVSPLLLRAAGVSRRAWFGGVRVGDLLIVGVPGDLSGEIAARWRSEARAKGIHLVPTSFNGAYAGYISPDAYYGELRGGRGLAYETGIMSWCGPDQESYFSALFHLTLASL